MSPILISILFTLAIFLSIIIIVYIVIKKLNIPFSYTRLVLSIYLTFLLISVSIFYAIADPSESVPMSDRYTTEEMHLREYNTQTDEFYNALYRGQLDEYEGAIVNKQWTLEYNQERLLVTIANNRDYKPPIAIKRKDVNDGKIEVASYSSKVPASYQDIVVNPPQVSIMENQLKIIPPQPKHVEMVYFDVDIITSAQFTGKGMFSYTGSHILPRHQVLYLQIPSELIIDTDNSTGLYLRYIGN